MYNFLKSAMNFLFLKSLLKQSWLFSLLQIVDISPVSPSHCLQEKIRQKNLSYRSLSEAVYRVVGCCLLYWFRKKTSLKSGLLKKVTERISVYSPQKQSWPSPVVEGEPIKSPAAETGRKGTDHLVRGSRSLGEEGRRSLGEGGSRSLDDGEEQVTWRDC